MKNYVCQDNDSIESLEERKDKHETHEQYRFDEEFQKQFE